MQLVLYFFIGLLCAVCNISLFAALVNVFPLFIAISIAFSLAAALNYLLCILILFRHKARWSAKGEFLAYVCGVGIMWGMDYLCTAGLSFLGMGLIPAKVCSSGIGFIGNFMVRKYLVF